MGQSVAYCGGKDPKDYSVTSALFPEARKDAYPTYEKTFDAVSNYECDYAVLPFEASLTGEFGIVLDKMFSGDLFINRIVDAQNDDEIVRYVVLSRKEAETVGRDGRFLIMFTVKDETGCLARAINTISDHGYNMSIMRSRPLRDLPWHYYFYVEAKGDYNDENGKHMIEALTAACESVKLLGRYTVD